MERSKKEPEWLAPVLLTITLLKNLVLPFSRVLVSASDLTAGTVTVNLRADPVIALTNQPPFVNPAPRRVGFAGRYRLAMTFRCSF